MSSYEDRYAETRRSRRTADRLEDTQPSAPEDHLAHYQAVRVARKRRRRRSNFRACIWGLLLGLALVALGYLVFPERFTILILGIARTPEGNVFGLSDNNNLLDVQTLNAEVRTYSIPRDLWVNIPYYGENRINTAHFLGEANRAGEGPALTMSTIRQNFGIQSDYYVRLQLEEFPKVIDALGGIKIDLPYKMGGLKKGVHKLNGDEALAFVRDRSGTYDFQRMQQGQVFAIALVKNLANPLKWLRLPFFVMALTDVVDTDIPAWEWPRLGFAMLRAVASGNYHSSTLPRKMTSSWVTPDGAMVLLPDWTQIIPHALKALGY